MSGADLSHRDYVSQLFSAHYVWLHTRLRRNLHSDSYAEDIAADTFVQLLNVPTPGGIREPRALLTTIAQRLVYQLWRRRSVERAYLMTLPLHDTQDVPCPESMAQLHQTLRTVQRQLEGLPDKVKSTFVLSRVNGMTYPEIAAQLGISQRSVSDYMNLALRRCSKTGIATFQDRSSKTRESV